MRITKERPMRISSRYQISSVSRKHADRSRFGAVPSPIVQGLILGVGTRVHQLGRCDPPVLANGSSRQTQRPSHECFYGARWVPIVAQKQTPHNLGTKVNRILEPGR